jgi:SOS-response transcriptional repressor LexA
MTRPHGLTARQRELLHFIEGEIARTGIAPSFQEMRLHLKVASNAAVSRLMQGLKERGAIDFIPRRSRSTVVLVERSVLPTLPAHVYARLLHYCASHDEKVDTVASDAIAIHIDAMEAFHRREADDVRAQ